MTNRSITNQMGMEVTAFIERSGMSKSDLELLMGLSPTSQGKTLRRWELYGAPPQAAILMSYMDRYGFDVARLAIAGGPQLPAE